MIINNVPSGPMAANTYLVIDENTKKGFIVDPGGYSRKTVSEIKEQNYELEYIILTHGHGDHIGGVPDYQKEFPNTRLVAAEAEKALLADAGWNFSRETCGMDLGLSADLYVKDGDKLKVGEMELRFLMTPGHTPGGMCILVDNCLFSGDTLFQSSIGRTDFPGGSFEQIAASIHQKLFVLPDDTQVFPGHMGPTTIGFEKRNNPFV